MLACAAPRGSLSLRTFLAGPGACACVCFPCPALNWFLLFLRFLVESGVESSQLRAVQDAQAEIQRALLLKAGVCVFPAPCSTAATPPPPTLAPVPVPLPPHFAHVFRVGARYPWSIFLFAVYTFVYACTDAPQIWRSCGLLVARVWSFGGPWMGRLVGAFNLVV